MPRRKSNLINRVDEDTFTLVDLLPLREHTATPEDLIAAFEESISLFFYRQDSIRKEVDEEMFDFLVEEVNDFAEGLEGAKELLAQKHYIALAYRMFEIGAEWIKILSVPIHHHTYRDQQRLFRSGNGRKESQEPRTRPLKSLAKAKWDDDPTFKKYDMYKFIAKELLICPDTAFKHIKEIDKHEPLTPPGVGRRGRPRKSG